MHADRSGFGSGSCLVLSGFATYLDSSLPLDDFPYRWIQSPAPGITQASIAFQSHRRHRRGLDGVGRAVGITMALMQFGAWSLVGMSLATELGSFIFTGSLSRWRPSWPSRQSGVRPLLAFGAHQTAASLIFSIARGCDTLLIGRFYGAAARRTLQPRRSLGDSTFGAVPSPDQLCFSSDLIAFAISTGSLSIDFSASL